MKHFISKGQTGVTDRYCQCHKDFDSWQVQGIHFVCRIREDTRKTVIRELPVPAESTVFYDAILLLGSTDINMTQYPVRVIAYHIGAKTFWTATDRFDLTAEQIVAIYLLRWKIEIFFGWWKHHLKVYHLLARSTHGLMIQLLAGLITYLLLEIYCFEHFTDTVSIYRLRQLCIDIRNEISLLNPVARLYKKFNAPKQSSAKT